MLLWPWPSPSQTSFYCLDLPYYALWLWYLCGIKRRDKKSLYSGWKKLSTRYEKGHQLSTYATVWGWRDHPKCLQLRIGGGSVKPHMYVSLFIFWQDFCLIVSCFICRNLTLPLVKKMCSLEMFISPPKNQFLSSWSKLNGRVDSRISERFKT